MVDTQVEERESLTLVSGGKKIFGILHRPVTQQRVPVVLMCHGFAGTKVGRFRMYVRLSEALCKVGIASLRIDFRGCGDSEGSFIDTTLEGQVEDALKGLQFLREHPQIDTDRIGILGRSLGGPVAVMVARRAKDIRSLALWAAVYHGDPWKTTWEENAKKLAGTPAANAPFVFQGHLTNPLLFLQLLQLNMKNELAALSHIPFLCAHSDKDEVVNPSHAHFYREARNGSTALSNFIRLFESSHDFSDHKEQDMIIKETVDWYLKTL